MNKFKRIKTSKFKKADAILCADLHIRADCPVCRTDNFLEAMEKKIDFIVDLSVEHVCPILVAGDIGHKHQWPNWLLEWTINKFYGLDVICIAGQHDLPNHRLDLWKKSGIGVLHASGVIFMIREAQTIDDIFTVYPFHYGEKMISPQYDKGLPKVAMTHQMIIDNKKLWPDQDAPEGHQILKKFPEYNLILSGDNHSPFVVEYKGRLLVNPGSLMRSTAAQEDHKPRVYLWYAEENKVQVVYLPIEQNVISREHIKDTKQRDKRMDAYMERMKKDVEIQLSFEKNMESYFDKNRTQTKVKEKVWEAVK